MNRQDEVRWNEGLAETALLQRAVGELREQLTKFGERVEYLASLIADKSPELDAQVDPLPIPPKPRLLQQILAGSEELADEDDAA